MTGVEAVRTESSEGIGLLAYTQEKALDSWKAHADKHILEAEARQLAVAGVTAELLAQRELLLDKISRVVELRAVLFAQLEDHLKSGLVRLDQHAAERVAADKELTTERLLHLDEKLTARMNAAETALTLRTSETEAHLTRLNGEQSRLQLDRERYQEKSVAHEKDKGDQVWREQVNKFMALNQGRENGVALVWAVMVAVIGVLLGVVGIVLAIVK